MGCQLVVTIDFAPTLAKLARIKPGHEVDGLSFSDLLVDEPPPVEAWRKDFLVEVYRRLPPLASAPLSRGEPVQDAGETV